MTTLTDWIHGQIECYGPSDLISNSLILYGEWAKHETDLIIQKLIKQDGFFLDIGAFIGTHCIALSKEHPTKNLRGIAIEANPRSFTLLNKNIELSKCLSIQTINAVVGDVNDKKMKMLLDNSNVGAAIAFECADNAEGGIYSITIDSLCLEELDFVKIDVEGMERKVLDGGMRTIREKRPVILLEFISLENHGFVLDYCRQIGYIAYGFYMDAFNPGNFKHNPRNIFGSARELAVIMSPYPLELNDFSSCSSFALFELKNQDDLVFLLSCKPQYGVELANRHNELNQFAPSSLFFYDQLTEAKKRLSEVTIEFSQIQEELFQTKAELFQTKVELSEASALLKQAKQDINQKELHIESQERLINVIINSKSWKALLPLRQAKDLFLSAFMRR